MGGRLFAAALASAKVLLVLTDTRGAATRADLTAIRPANIVAAREAML